MSLDYQLDAIQDHETVCWEVVSDGDEQPANRMFSRPEFIDEETGQRMRMRPVTFTLIFVMPAIGMREITRASASEVYARIRLAESIGGAFLRTIGTDGEAVPHPFTPAMVAAHIGLRTNVSNETTAKFRTRMVTSAMDDAVREYNRMQELAAMPTEELVDKLGDAIR